ncbi:MAG: class I SAM-dependent methyltransferase, partial [Anaerolineae bacterium]|nr:class I SAM-dependent methyltransferase [Anaerolineae bacterium]
LASGSADLVTCRRAAHHFRDLTAFLSEAHRVLRPGSLLLVEDRSVLEDPWVDRIMNQLDRLHDPSHVREYRPSEWRTALEHAGFTVLRLELRERLRPLSSLTDNASPAAASEIRAIFARLSEEERSALSAVGSGESSRSNHWYITVLAERA